MSSVESPERVRFRAEVRSLELQLRAIANAPVPRRAGALRSDGKRAGVHARWRWNAKHIQGRKRDDRFTGVEKFLNEFGADSFKSLLKQSERCSLRVGREVLLVMRFGQR